MKENVIKVLIGFSASLFLFLQVHAQQYNGSYNFSPSLFTVERSLTTEEGLPANGVNAVMQDSRGYIWAATYNGLVRYDGKKMKTYNRSSIPNLQSNRFLNIVEDSQGRIWAGLEYHNLILIDDSVQVFTIPETKEGFNEHVTEIREGANGKIWIGTNQGLLFYNNGIFERVERLKSESVQRILHYQNFSYVLFQTSLYRFFPDGTFDKELLNIDENGVINHPNYSIAEIAAPSYTFSDLAFHDGKLWVISHGGLVQVEHETYNIFVSAKELGNGLLWGFRFIGDTLFVHGSGGLNAFTGWSNEGLKVERYSQSTTNDILIDYEGSVWQATATQGLRQHISTPVKQSTEYEPLKGKAVTAILKSEKNGALYTGTNCDGLYEFSEDGVQQISSASGIENDCVWSLMEQSDGTLWAGTWGRGVYYRPAGEKNFQPFRPEAMQNANAILSIYEDAKGNIWFGTYYNGLFRKKGDSTEPMLDKAGNMLESVRSFYEDQNNRLWITTDQGVLYYEDDIIGFPQEFAGIRNQNIRTMQQDSNGRYWLGSYGGGLFTLAPGGELISISHDEGLFDDTISQLAFDKSGNLWLAGNLGVFFIEKAQIEQFLAGEISRLNVSKFGVKEGLPIRETTGGFMPSSYMDEDGVLYIPTVQGLAVIHTDKMTVNRTEPQIIIEGAEIDGKEYTSGEISTISYKNQRLVFNFAVLTFANPDYTQFEYRLDGLDQEWHSGEDVQEIVYTSLSPGDYTLHVRASNNDGIWNKAGTALAFSVQAPFWQTFWFNLIIFLGLCAMVVGIIKYRTYLYERREKELTKLVDAQTATIRKEKERLEKAYADLEENKALIEKSKSTIEEQATLLKRNDEMRSRFFANVSHELRTPLTLIKGILKQMLKKPSASNSSKFVRELNTIATHANRLQAQVDYLLELSRLETGEVQLNKQVFDLNNQVLLLEDLFQTLSAENQVNFSFIMSEQPVLIEADTEKVEKILLSLFSRFLQYTESEGWIQFQTLIHKEGNENWAKLIVKSSSNDLSEEEKKKLFDLFYYQTKTPGIPVHAGFSLAKEWIKLHNGSLTFKSNDNKLCMEVKLPRLALESAPVQDAVKIEVSQEIKNIGRKEEETQAFSVRKFDVNKKTIAIIDDNMLTRVYLRDLLQKDYNIIEAEDAKEAYEIITNAEDKPDLIISDLMMPEMNGDELCRKIRKNSDTSTIPFILLTAKSGDDSYIEGVKSGINAFIAKPFKEKVLIETAKNLIDNQEKLIRQVQEKQNLDQLVQKNQKDSFLMKLDKLITENMESADLSVESLANRLHISQRQLQRKIKEETGLTPKQYLRKRRLEAAKLLIEQNYGSITEVAYAVGFNTLSLFSSYFKKEYGALPSDWNSQKEGSKS